MQQLPCDEDISRFLSIQGKGAESWLQVIPSLNKVALEPCAFCLAACSRLGVSLQFPSWLGQCECGRSLGEK